MSEERTLTDDELGRILIHRSARARRITFRCKEGVLTCTTPPHTSTSQVARVVNEMRGRLRGLAQRGRDRHTASLFTPQSRIEAEGFTFSCLRDDGGKPRVREDARGMTFLYPGGLDWSSDGLQQWLTRVVEECLRRRATRTLIPRLLTLAGQRGLHVREATVRKTKSRWGSCSSKGDIHLSLYLMLLPPHLRDFIMQHELTHLLEMNHGPRFHALLNQAVAGQEEALQREMRQFHTTLTLQQPSP